MKIEEMLEQLASRSDKAKEREDKEKTFFEEFNNLFAKLKITGVYAILSEDKEIGPIVVYNSDDNRWTAFGLLKTSSCMILNGEKIHQDYKGIKAFMDAKAPEWVIVIEIKNGESVKVISNIESRAQVLGAIVG